MKVLAHLLLIITAAMAFSGCVYNWAARNEPISIVPDLQKAIEIAPTRPIKLTDSQKDQLFHSLHGPARSEFMEEDLQPDVWVSWFGTSSDWLVFARYAKDNSHFVWVSHQSDGHLFGFGRGNLPGDPPWRK